VRQDRNFDDLVDRFENKFYASEKGRLRLQLVQRALVADSHALKQSRPLRILDIGCGLGQMAQWLAAQGHTVVACDLSPAIVERAQARIADQDPQLLERITFLAAPLQSLDGLISGKFDLVLFHAVLEWLAEPAAALQAAASWLAPTGELSLLFYNRDSLVFKNLLRSDFRRVEANDYAGDQGGLTPSYPLEIAAVERWVNDNGLSIVQRRGIRTFADYLPHSLDRRIPARVSEAELLDMEWQFSTRSPFRELARYQLWQCVQRGTG
jgi:S-adenosylmethionine-dependent methyltransferase